MGFITPQPNRLKASLQFYNPFHPRHPSLNDDFLVKKDSPNGDVILEESKKQVILNKRTKIQVLTKTGTFSNITVE